MLSRCKGKPATSCVRCIAIPASTSSFSRAPSTTERQQEAAKNREDEVWKSVLKAIPTSSRWQTLPRYRQRNALDPDFFSSRRMGQSRKYTTDAKQGDSSRPSPDEPDSLFNSSQSAWDHVFDNIDNMPPLDSLPTTPRPRSSVRASSPDAMNARRQTMTAREIDAFNNMFNMIFNAVSRSDQAGTGTGTDSTGTSTTARPRTAADRRADKAARHDPLSGVGIGSGPEGTSSVGDLFGKLRRVSRTYRWSPAEDAELERKTAQMELCETDQQLLDWAAHEVFEESARYEEVARQAVVRAESGSAPSPDSISDPSKPQPDPNPSSSPNPTSSFSSPLPLQPPAYPHLLAALMRTFRDKFRDPHLALSIFAHARSRSIASFVFGCTAPAYNELLRTLWAAFRDLRGVADALSEMRVNGIAPDARTRALVEELRREVGARTVWQEERNIGTGEVFELLNQIETLSRKPVKEDRDQRQKKGKHQGKNKSRRWRTSSAEQWKSGSDGDSGGKYKFGEWDFSRSAGRKSDRRTSDRDRHSAPPAEANRLAFE